jgi:hypothetical protein
LFGRLRETLTSANSENHKAGRFESALPLKTAPYRSSGDLSLDLSGDGDSVPQEAETREGEVLACELLSVSARRSHYGQKEVTRRFDLEKVGFYPVREPDASFTLP